MLIDFAELSPDLKALEWFVFVKRFDSGESRFKGEKEATKRKKGKIFQWGFAYQQMSSPWLRLPLPHKQGLNHRREF